MLRKCCGRQSAASMGLAAYTIRYTVAWIRWTVLWEWNARVIALLLVVSVYTNGVHACVVLCLYRFKAASCIHIHRKLTARQRKTYGFFSCRIESHFEWNVWIHVIYFQAMYSIEWHVYKWKRAREERQKKMPTNT